MDNKNFCIASTDIAPILGISKWYTPFDVWNRKINPSTKFEGNKYTESGNILEPVIIKWFEEKTNVIVDSRQKKFVYKKDGRLITFIDGKIENEFGEFLIEVKNTSSEINPNDLPEEWVSEINWNMGLSNIHSCYLVWLSKGYDFNYVRVDFSEDNFNIQIEYAINFLEKYIVTGIEPPPINSNEILQRIKPEDKQKEVDKSLFETISRWKELKKTLKECEEEIKELEEDIKMFMCESTVAVFKGQQILTWRQDKPGFKFNEKLMKESYPDIYEQFLEQKQPVRRLLAK